MRWQPLTLSCAITQKRRTVCAPSATASPRAPPPSARASSPPTPLVSRVASRRAAPRRAMSSPDTRRRRARKTRPLVVPADTLLTFSRYSPPETQRSSPPQRALTGRHSVRGGESLVQASHRFALLPHVSACVLDALLKPIEWQLVELVFVVGKPQCPICLNGVSVPRITPCGHVFDHVCFLQHLSFAADEQGCAPCPLCSSSVSASDLRACCFVDANVLQLHVPFRMTLVSSHKRALIAVAHHTGGHNALPTNVSLRRPFFSRFAIADPDFLLELVASDMRHLRRVLREDASVSAHVKVAMGELKQKKEAYRARRHGTVEAEASSENERSQLWYFYQASDTTNVFLHPVNHRCLNTEFECDFEKAPREIEGEVLQIHRHTMDDQLRKRYRFLSHLPNGCEFSFVELDLKQLLSARTLNIHAHELKEREKGRKHMQMISRKEDRLREKHESQQMKRYLNSQQSAESSSAHSQLQTVDSTDCTNFPALNEQGQNEEETQDVGEARRAEEGSRAWGSEVSSYSSVTSNMGVFPALGDVGVAANSGRSAAQGAWGSTCSSSSARSPTREARKQRRGHGKCTIVLSNAGAQHRR